MTTETREASRYGQAFLSYVLLVGGAVLIISVLIAFFATTFVDQAYGYKYITQAHAAAVSGIEDGLMQINRNFSFSSAGYTLVVGSSTVTVGVSITPTPLSFVVSSTATAGDRTRKMTAVVAVNSSTGQPYITSWTLTQ